MHAVRKIPLCWEESNLPNLCVPLICFKSLTRIHATLSLMWKQTLKCLAASICSPDRELNVPADQWKLSENGVNWVFDSYRDGICSLMAM